MFENIKKAISGIILSCMLLLPFMQFASEHENTQRTKQTKYDMVKNTIKNTVKDVVQGYGTFLGGAIVHEFGHWLFGKMIHNCNSFFCIHLSGLGTTYYYYNPTNKELIKEILTKEYIDKNYSFKKPLNRPTKCHPFVSAAGPLFGIGYSLLVPLANTFYNEYTQGTSVLGILKRTALQPYINNKTNFNILLGACSTFTGNILNLIPFMENNDGNRILKCFNIHCPTYKTTEIIFPAVAATALLMLANNINAVLPAAT